MNRNLVELLREARNGLNGMIAATQRREGETPAAWLWFTSDELACLILALESENSQKASTSRLSEREAQ